MSNWRIGIDAARPPRREPRTKGVSEAAAKGAGDEVGDKQPESAGKPFGAIFDKLVKWIPGDTLAIYLPGVTMLASKEDAKPSFVFLLAMIGFSFLITVLAAFSTGAKIGLRTWISAVLGAFAFAIWSLSVPFNGWQQWEVVAQNQAAVAIAAAALGLIFGLVAEGVLRRVPN